MKLILKNRESLVVLKIYQFLKEFWLRKYQPISSGCSEVLQSWQEVKDNLLDLTPAKRNRIIDLKSACRL